MARTNFRLATSWPLPFDLSSPFWEKTQRRLHPEKIVPDPARPRTTQSVLHVLYEPSGATSGQGLPEDTGRQLGSPAY